VAYGSLTMTNGQRRCSSDGVCIEGDDPSLVSVLLLTSSPTVELT
jgi:hypothetical protein